MAASSAQSFWSMTTSAPARSTSVDASTWLGVPRSTVAVTPSPSANGSPSASTTTFANPSAARSSTSTWDGKAGIEHPDRAREPTQRVDVEVLGARAAEEQVRRVVERRRCQRVIARKRMPAAEIGASAVRRQPGVADHPRRAQPDVQPRVPQGDHRRRHALAFRR